MTSTASKVGDCSNDEILRFPRYRLPRYKSNHDIPIAFTPLEKVRWMWPRRIAYGKVTLLDGDPGVGKSLVMADIAARVSTGRPMPFCKGSREPRNVIILSADDDNRTIIGPRLQAAKADRLRIVVPPLFRESDGKMLYEIPGEIKRVERRIRRQKAALVIIDPLSAFVPRNYNLNDDQDVRRALTPLDLPPFSVPIIMRVPG